jgi:hypothetical protein
VSFDTALAFVLQRENGYVVDSGGATNLGISQRAYPHEDIKGMTQARAAELYRRDYWTPAGCDTLPAPLDLVVFDTAVNMGVARATALRTANPTLPALLWARLEAYRQVVKKRPDELIYLPGWLRRMILLEEATR